MAVFEGRDLGAVETLQALLRSIPDVALLILGNIVDRRFPDRVDFRYVREQQRARAEGAVGDAV